MFPYFPGAFLQQNKIPDSRKCTRRVVLYAQQVLCLSCLVSLARFIVDWEPAWKFRKQFWNFSLFLSVSLNQCSISVLITTLHDGSTNYRFIGPFIITYKSVIAILYLLCHNTFLTETRRYYLGGPFSCCRNFQWTAVCTTFFFTAIIGKK